MTDQQLINISQAPMLAFNKRDWGGASFIATADFVWADVAVGATVATTGTQNALNSVMCPAAARSQVN